MRVGIITPAPPGSKYGNRVTALRWARLLRELGHRVSVKQIYKGEPFDLLIALHARRSHASVRRFHNKYPQRPLIVALSGTDLYRDLHKSWQAQESLELASRIVALQPKASEELRPEMRHKIRVIYQSVAAKSLKPDGSRRKRQAHRRGQAFEICVVGHLRSVKDPFRAAMAARLLPPSSRIRIVQVGRAMTEAMRDRARKEMAINPRYHWFKEQPPWRAQRLLAQSDLCVLSSHMEGGANVLSEAIVASVPILASKIPGTVGILGEDYPGYFTVGNTRELASLMMRAETDPAFTQALIRWGERVMHHFNPGREKESWAELLSEL
jgi:putative glycosyltransferase (TIGR04348 family)